MEEYQAEVRRHEPKPLFLRLPRDISAGNICQVTIEDRSPQFDGVAKKFWRPYRYGALVDELPDAYRLLVSVAPWRGPPTERGRLVLQGANGASYLADVAAMRYREFPLHLRSIDGELQSLFVKRQRLRGPPCAPWVTSEPWEYLSSASHFDWRVRARRSIPKALFRPEITFPHVINYLLNSTSSHYQRALVTLQYDLPPNTSASDSTSL